MVSHHPANLGDPRHCGSGDMMFVVVEGQDSTCPPLDPSLLLISCHARTHYVSGRRHNSLLVFPMRDFGHTQEQEQLTELNLKNFCQSFQKQH